MQRSSRAWPALLGLLLALGCGEPGGAEIVAGYGARTGGSPDGTSSPTVSLRDKVEEACIAVDAKMRSCFGDSGQAQCQVGEAISEACLKEMLEFYQCYDSSFSCAHPETPERCLQLLPSSCF